MDKLIALLENIKNLDINKILFEVWDSPKVQDFIIELNTDGQLFESGIDSTGRTLESIGGGYAFKTIEEKEKRGLPTDRVTLFDTGAFYDSFEVTPFKTGFEISSDPFKDGESLFVDWGDKIEGLTDINKEILGKFILNVLIQEVAKSIQKGI